MKKKTLTTTEFYKNPSQALNFVKEGGVVYLGYKNLQKPIAVITSIDDYVTTKKQEKKVDRMAVLKKYKFKSKYWKSGLDLQKYMRE